MKLYVVRHGRTDWNIEKRTQGWSHNSLNALGFSQAEALANEITNYPIEHFYCSDLLRTKQTAEILNKKLNLEIKFDKRLREKSSGNLEGILKSEITYWKDFYADPHKYNAETWEDVFIRVKNFLDEIKAKKLNNILLVSHHGTINIINDIISTKKQTWDNAEVEELVTSRFVHFASGSLTEFEL